MPAPTNPRKRALMASGKLRKALRAAGHHLDPVVQIGKEGMTAPLLRELDAQLLAHELVKVKVGTESPEDRFEVADRLAGEAGAQVAQVLGRTVLVYRRHPEKPRYEVAPASSEPQRGLGPQASGVGPRKGGPRKGRPQASGVGPREKRSREARTGSRRPGRTQSKRPATKRPARRRP